MKTSPWRPLVAAPALLLTLAASVGCSDDSDGALDRASSSTPSEGAAEHASGEQEGAGRERTTRGRGESLGSTTGQHPSTPLDQQLVPLRIDVTGLERHGELVELYMTLTNEGDAEFAPYSAFGSETGSSYDLSGVALVDQGGQKLYLPAVDSEGVCLCTGNLANVYLPAGETLGLEATIGGIPDDVETVDLHIAGFDPVTGLEIAG